MRNRKFASENDTAIKHGSTTGLRKLVCMAVETREAKAACARLFIAMTTEHRWMNRCSVGCMKRGRRRGVVHVDQLGGMQVVLFYLNKT